ncbi:carbamoyl phosphate synthase large subunit [Anoxybacter fermentans]|uniref:Carbamoyl phosphate synthase large chain n=1 Tax=Anoxybacter fermentans TaxID=1323375 RepID=A0A3Q9HQ27_9FIRM|nr:carbamoyl-phosphate synthase (glutamine-hydrolyzing) large subunit [Anoxybacter fermentans]AZR73007.1 carbamoyl phosphate synthase large subunit [Anoxybacter fermentans]
MKRKLEKILVIGSGPIVIGQAAEFDYAGTQACRALKEQGYQVILINSNPATVMTDREIADKIYIEPLNLKTLKRIIEIERPDGILGTLGGQIGLNLLVELGSQGILKKYNVKVLGTSLMSIQQAEDREKFRQLMHKIQEPVLESYNVSELQDVLWAAEKIGYPVIVRPAYTLGGSGGGTASNKEELIEIAKKGFSQSPLGQILIEKSIIGWKEIEYEVVRDNNDNCITICNMENIDPVGIHTGDSIVVAPSQTLSDQEYQMLRRAAIKIVRALAIRGACNVQFALDPNSNQYYVIEVNTRVSRSSALASKATGYPIAKVAALIAIGLNLDQITNPITGKTTACFEPSLDYVVCKIPRWPFDKFDSANRNLGTQMKATGEVMAIGRNFASALMKAVRSLDSGFIGLYSKKIHQLEDRKLLDKLKNPDDERIFALAEGFRRGWSLERLNQLTGINPFFLTHIDFLVRMEKRLKREKLTGQLLKEAKVAGFTDWEIGVLTGKNETEIRALRKKENIEPVYKMVDTCAGEFKATTPYFYSTYEDENEVEVSGERKILVIGSGPIRIGQGIEFDYCSVHAIMTARKLGYTALVINNNPETVSTDFDVSDRLYFEPLTLEDVLNVVQLEKPEGIIIQFGGQTAINLAEDLYKHGVPILGTDVTQINICEDREKFYQLMEELQIPVPKGKVAYNADQVWKQMDTVGYPVLVRPSYVLGGQAMEVIETPQKLEEYLQKYEFKPGLPLLLDPYITGIEVEVDAVCDSKDVLIPGIMEHIERAGIHSGDSITVFPGKRLSSRVKKRIAEMTILVGKGLKIKGIYNIQFIVTPDEEVYILEVNPRSSRTVPFLSKVTGVPMVQIATQVILGAKLRELGYGTGILKEPEITAVKAPVFSFAKLDGLDPVLGPEMKSTGEVMGLGKDMAEALLKALEGTGKFQPETKALLVTIGDEDKEQILPWIRKLYQLGFKIYATRGTGFFLRQNGIDNTIVEKVGKGEKDIIDLIQEQKIDYIFNTPSKNGETGQLIDGYRIRRKAVEFGIPIFTNLDSIQAFSEALEHALKLGWTLEPISLCAIERRL